MIVVWMTLFLLLSLCVAWLLLFEEARQRAVGALVSGWTRLSGRFRRLGAKGGQAAFAAIGNVASKGRIAGAGLRVWRLPIIVAALMLLVPFITILVSRRTVALEGFDLARQQGTSELVQQLLRGERLIPPPAPPPEVFMTVEVERVLPMTASADRKWERLDPQFTQTLLAVFKVMKDRHGYEMVLVEGYRSPERQDALAAKGRHVTRARGGQSWHQYGLAADSAFMRDGKLVISEKDPWAMRGYQLYGQVAKEAGLVWGGDWTSIRDLMHVELRRPGVRKR